MRFGEPRSKCKNFWRKLKMHEINYLNMLTIHMHVASKVISQDNCFMGK